jgi:hypothetical protein
MTPGWNVMTSDAAGAFATVVVALYLPWFLLLPRCLGLFGPANHWPRKTKILGMVVLLGFADLMVWNLLGTELSLLAVINSNGAKGSDAQGTWRAGIASVASSMIFYFVITTLLAISRTRLEASDTGS